MITAVDTSVILAIFKNESRSELWLHTLKLAAAAGSVVISEVVYAEVAAFFLDLAEIEQQMEMLAIELLPSTKATLFEAGRIYASYRKAGGARSTMAPDFLVGAHAAIQANQLASADRGYLRAHFTGLKLLSI
jgi:predicted nucleic acid-binding protein